MWRRHELAATKAAPLRYGFYLLLILAVFQPVRSRFAASTGSAVQPERVVQLLTGPPPQDSRSRSLWLRLEPSVVAWNRILEIITDLTRMGPTLNKEKLKRLEHWIDKVYLDGQINTLTKRAAQESEINLYLLGHYAVAGENPETQVLALVLIRELFPKKASVFFANNLIHSPHPLVARVAEEIIYDRFKVEGLANKVKTGYFLMAPGSDE